MIITPNYIGDTVNLYNGKDFYEIKVISRMVGERFGNFIHTRKNKINTRKKKVKKKN
jgi:ribosomal protein S19